MLRPEVLAAAQERQRAFVALLSGPGACTDADLPRLRVVDVGCGDGGHLLELLRLGFTAPNLQGIELLPDRLEAARQRLPAAVRLHEGDASAAPIAPLSQDLVCQSLVFSSLLDDAFQQRLAAAMWSWLRPGGAVVWHDFVYDNPRNPDVRGVPRARIAALFPQASLHLRRITLAPPISRAAGRIAPWSLGLLNTVPLLRTHLLCWLRKPQTPDGPHA